MSNDVPTGPGESAAGIDYLSFLKRRWTPVDFSKAALLLAIAGTLYYFFCVVHIYQGLPISLWAWARFAPRYNFEHGKLVLPIFAVLVWMHREELAKAKKKGCNQGLIWVVVGLLVFAIGVRTLQGRIGMAAGPFLLYGIVLYLWGKEVARILLFPIAFLVFMIPASAIEDKTANLQFLVTGIARVVCGLLGMPLWAEGTTLHPVDRSFSGFNIAEGCSGIRSLMAMVMLTTIYVHLTQTKLWKKAVILLCSIGFAIIGNAGRIVSIFMVAKYVNPNFAGNQYHEVSGYISFPIALGAMLLLSRILDLPYFDAVKKITEAKPDSDHKDAQTYDY